LDVYIVLGLAIKAAFSGPNVGTGLRGITPSSIEVIFTASPDFP
jgi:hypothetical protein